MHINLQVQIGKGGVLCGLAVIAYLKDATNHGSLLYINTFSIKQ
jgi:hypothetical protein